MADAIPRTLSLLGADVPLQGGFPSPGTSKVQLLQVTAPAAVRWLKKMECPLSQGKATPAGGWDCRAHSGVPGARQLHSLDRSGCTRAKWGQTGQGHRDTPAPCHLTHIHSLSTQLHSHGCTHGWMTPAWLAQQPKCFAFI